MVVVKVRETYDLCTVKNKMTVISIHTPKPDIIKRNYPGLLMQCRAYRPLQAQVRVACASVQPLDPKGVGLEDGDVAPEDIFNPILYKAISNKGMSQLEARINALTVTGSGLDVAGDTVSVEVDSFTAYANEFPVYYGLLAQTHEWKHANPQAGLAMSGLKPLVYEMVYNVGDMQGSVGEENPALLAYPADSAVKDTLNVRRILGNARPFPFLPCTSYSEDNAKAVVGLKDTGFQTTESDQPVNASIDVPYIDVVCGVIIVPPSKLHQLFYRLVCEWDIEFSKIRPIGEITDWAGLASIGNNTHYQNYSYPSTKEAVTGSSDTILKNDQCMVAANVDINKVM